MRFSTFRLGKASSISGSGKGLGRGNFAVIKLASCKVQALALKQLAVCGLGALIWIACFQMFPDRERFSKGRFLAEGEEADLLSRKRISKLRNLFRKNSKTFLKERQNSLKRGNKAARRKPTHTELLLRTAGRPAESTS